MRWGQEKLRCGDADVTIWGGLNGVGSDPIGEQSEGGLREKGFGSGIRDRRTAACSRHSHRRKRILSRRRTTTTDSPPLVLDSPNAIRILILETSNHHVR
jgi:hypothetical protein